MVSLFSYITICNQIQFYSPIKDHRYGYNTLIGFYSNIKGNRKIFAIPLEQLFDDIYNQVVYLNKCASLCS